MLFIIGLGLSDLEDVTLKGLRAIESSDKIYLEHYTSILGGGEAYYKELEAFYKKPITLADRTMVEQNSDEIIESAKTSTVSFLVVGDPFGATTHTDLVLRAIEKGVKYKIIHNASIMNAIGCCGLQLYSFGETVSICYWLDSWRPKSYFLKICENKARGLHTLCLLDIKVKEKSVENLIKGRDVYEKPRFMTVSEATSQLVEILDEFANLKLNGGGDEDEEEDADESSKPSQETVQIKSLVDSKLIDHNTICVGLARVGRDDQQIAVDSLANLANMDLGGPLHSLIVAGRLHPLEIDFLKLFYRTNNNNQKNDEDGFKNLIENHNRVHSK